MANTKAPARLWNFCAVDHSKMRNFTTHPLFNLHGQTPDISEYTKFGCYDIVWHLDQEIPFPADKRKLAKWLGITHHVDKHFVITCYPIVAVLLFVRQYNTFSQMINNLKRYNKQSKTLMIKLKSRIVDVTQSKLPQEPLLDVYEPYEAEAEKPEVDDFMAESYNAMISAEILLPKGDVLLPAIVTGCKHDAQGNPIGRANSNPILDSRIYEVQFQSAT
jgi:hypothetical protein